MSLLFDHLVGTREQRERHGKAESFGGGEIYHQVELGPLLNRKIGRFYSAQNLIDEIASAPGQVREVVGRATLSVPSEVS